MNKLLNYSIFTFDLKALKRLNFPKNFPRIINLSLIAFFITLSLLSWIISYYFHFNNAYNDAMSHLNISRMIIDNQEPGFSQLGGVWLPLPHILSLSLIWNNWLWHSGLAGSIYSSLSFLISIWAVYKIMSEFSKKRLPAIVASLTFGLNLNILYLQTTALSENLFIGLFLLSTLMFIRLQKTYHLKYLIFLGILGFLLVLTRYDGYFIIFIEGLLIACQSLWQKKPLSEISGKLVLFFSPIVLGMVIWLMWGLLIFHNPFYFAIGPYSAHSQQALIENKVGLITQGSLFNSAKAYFLAVVDNVGSSILIISLGGVIGLMSEKLKVSFKTKVLILMLLLSPIIFNILSLFLGFSVLNVPELGWNPSSDTSGIYFNVRYGILALPLFAILAGLYANLGRLFGVVVIAVVIFQAVITYQTGIITLIDGTKGSSAFKNQDIAQVLKTEVKPNDEVLMSTSFFNPVAFESNLNLNQFIHEGVSKKWNYALSAPQSYAPWVVMANGDIGEPVYTSLINNQKGSFLRLYQLYFKGDHANIYHLKSADEIFVNRLGQNLYLNNQQFVIRGVNSYDLAYYSDQEIRDSLHLLSQQRVNTVRFWAFGDGTPDGFQPIAGITQEERLKKLDLIINTAKTNNIRLIPVLVNNWDDYGGKKQYLQWAGQDPITQGDNFYTNQAVIDLFKNYVNKIVTRQNSITQVNFSNEPAILAWDIINEPRVEGDPQILSDWSNQMSEYIKSLDNNHLVMVGTEGVVKNLDQTQVANICSLKSIDICSVHFYLEHQNQPIFEDINQLNTYLLSQQQAASKEGKMVILEEIGIPKNSSLFNLTPLELFKQTLSTAQKLGYQGTLIWNWSLKGDDSYGFSPQGVDGNYDLNQLKTLLQ